MSGIEVADNRTEGVELRDVQPRKRPEVGNGGDPPPQQQQHNNNVPARNGPTTNNNRTARKGKCIPVKVLLLDDTLSTFEIQTKACGQELFNAVKDHLQLGESDYFGLEYNDPAGNTTWLDPMKMILKQVKDPKKVMFRFCVKFFSPDPGQLHDEFTRYLFALQVRRDLATGRLPSSDNTAALMASYIVQAEVGDFAAEEHPESSYITEFKFVPNQTPQMENKIMEFHQKLAGQTPADADRNFLDIARRLEMYGIRLHPAHDHDGVKINLAVANMGVLIFQGHTKINTFSWAKIRKLSFKRKRFLIKLHPEAYGLYNATVEFVMSSRDACKSFWKLCIEYHAFFRLEVRPKPVPKSILFSRGSSFRFSGRTQKQLIEEMREGGSPSKNPKFQRSHRLRASTQSLQIMPTHEPVSRLDTNNMRANSFSHYETQDPRILPYTKPRPPDTTVVQTTTPLGKSGDLDRDEHVAMHDLVGEMSGEHEAMQGLVQQMTSEHDQMQHLVKKITALHADSDEVIDERDGGEKEEAGTPGSEDIIPETPTKVRKIDPSSIGDIPGNVSAEKSPVLSPLSSVSTSPQPSVISPDRSPLVTAAPAPEEEETRKKRYPADKAYYIAKELLSTERTYLKDLEVIVVWFRNAVIQDMSITESLAHLLFDNFDPLYEFHRGFLKEIEQRMALWEGRSNAHLKGDYQRIGDILLKNMKSLKLYMQHIEKHEEILLEMEKATRRNQKLENVYKEFEMQKVCYLPLNTFLLKPAQRLLHYRLILERLVKHYPVDHRDYKDCRAALAEIMEATSNVQDSMNRLENFQKLTELQRDLVSCDNLVQPGREFIREGCLHKLSRKGFQQRMFFLFSDMILYTSKGVTATNQFKVHGQLPVQGMVVEESEMERAVANCFTIYSTNKSVVVAASTTEEKDKWMEDINDVIVNAAERGLGSQDSSFSRSSDEMGADREDGQDESEDDVHSPRGSLDRTHTHHRANTTMHVCWHRNTSVSMADHTKSVENQLSGYLLRKFKNSNGWQKLWVVFTNFCLFFYKTHQDDYPLASLPLLGYQVSTPGETDNIHKDYVFKLQFKTHVYFFRAESEYTFGRWMEVISSATFSASRTRIFSRKES
ncbi:PREDICTED: FERM, RhoGEF and pleckstrin domain-containing protein 1-like isoform X2 [Branchiostoma belcheri]|uniref:FERM, ARHGEF and pleckstrin domain-containing protein 1 n=1 Tax=Branchiostoma belcheri TaxID=7741 RepID=A0A6P4YE27_BRABE|nr:PREDICTED: FERM, RhoGEF and pleckstrin domain-containing protein 1-like isoform X2 [Branchiostoma belcheri]